MNQLVEELSVIGKGVNILKSKWSEGLARNYTIELGNEDYEDNQTFISIFHLLEKNQAKIKLSHKRGKEQLNFFETTLFEPKEEELITLSKDLNDVFEYSLYKEGNPKEEYRKVTEQLTKLFHTSY